MTPGGGHGGFETQRGTFYYWRDAVESGALMRRMRTDDEEIALVPKGCSTCGTALSAEGFYYVAADRNEVWQYIEKTGRSVRMFQRPVKNLNQFTISADGRWFVYGFGEAPSVDLMIMEDFH
jgi:tricorn protease-like protein